MPATTTKAPGLTDFPTIASYPFVSSPGPSTTGSTVSPITLPIFTSMPAQSPASNIPTFEPSAQQKPPSRGSKGGNQASSKSKSSHGHLPIKCNSKSKKGKASHSRDDNGMDVNNATKDSEYFHSYNDAMTSSFRSKAKSAESSNKVSYPNYIRNIFYRATDRTKN
jgi:hypothetical protein